VLYSAVAPLGFFLMGLLHSAWLRGQCVRLGTALGRPLRTWVVEGPLWLARHTSLKEVTESWPFQLCYWYVLKPLVIVAAVVIVAPLYWDGGFTLAVYGLVFLAAMFFINSRPGLAAAEFVAQTLSSFLDLLRGGMIPGLYNLVVRVFKEILHLGEAFLFTVDEWLRFRGGDSRPAMVLRAVLSILWFPVAYVIRFNVVVLIEPCFNPLKFPIVTIATKIMLPLLYILKDLLPEKLNPFLGTILGNALSWWVVFWLPDAVAFIIWEMKENWSLYRANRRQTLRPVTVGGRGETLRDLLHPGFHIGTVPRLFARLRQAERAAARTGSWSSVRACQSALADVEKAVGLFVTREFCELLRQTPAWQGQPPRVGRVSLATNQIRLELHQPDYPDQVLCLEFENEAGALVAGIAAPGWLEALPPAQRMLLHNALATLYKLAGVDQIRAQLHTREPAAEKAIATEPRQQTFQQIPITWEQCVTCWQTNSTATAQPGLLGDSLDLFPIPRPARPEIVNGSASLTKG
jgi:hypothetical protein